MNPIEKAIAALEEVQGYADCQMITLPNVNEALQALRSMQEVDVEGLKKESALEGRMMFSSAYMNGWNECVEHMSKNYLLIPKEGV
ncbi:MAG: hypothetical protein CMC15_18670 [Flavobacteriaceae bacterium]|mgnify:CR=1 FL=1|nr:hypothetical protein [Flavobacteriaceae bacterium]|tara:strand:- start:672 stop:929 length:258 start_codon:yes stop_codon:yes gene_type:complete